jgi:hypothetical protein
VFLSALARKLGFQQLLIQRLGLLNDLQVLCSSSDVFGEYAGDSSCRGTFLNLLDIL